MNSERQIPSFPNLNNLPIQPRRLMAIAIVGAVIITGFVILNVLRGIYTNWLWFDNLGHLDVYTKILSTRIWLFLAGFIAAILVISLNFL